MLLQYSWAPFVAMVFPLLFLRLIFLDGDFPYAATWSSAIYTDEGWYASSAARSYLGDPWYIAGDFNLMVNLPIGQLVHRAFFELFGMSLWSARLSGVLAFSIATFVVVRLLLQISEPIGAFVAGLLLSGSNFGFVFSRFAVMENLSILFVMIAISLGFMASRSGSRAWLVLASFFSGFAILTKSTMIFSIPLLALVALFGCGSLKQRVVSAFFVTVPATCMFLLWSFLANEWYPADVAYFSTMNFHDRMVRDPFEYLINIRTKMLSIQQFGSGLFWLWVASSILGLALMWKGEVAKVFWIMATFLVGYVLLMAIIRYNPPRYHVPLLFPVATMIGLVIARVCRLPWLATCKVCRILFLIPFLFLVGKEVVANGSLLMNVQFSFRDMARDIGSIVREDSLSEPVLLGEISDSVALEANLRSRNISLATDRSAHRVLSLLPSYYVAFGEPRLPGPIVKAGGKGELVQTYRVFDNIKGPVHFWRVHWPEL